MSTAGSRRRVEPAREHDSGTRLGLAAESSVRRAGDTLAIARTLTYAGMDRDTWVAGGDDGLADGILTDLYDAERDVQYERDRVLAAIPAGAGEAARAGSL